ncbi:hypothetical protein FB45DRAFT_940928 [Roridomyces roridus]|uniref:Cytochrome P450 n=1 Tax=Roridomyces roridus TaxID=1738132 RepID=A0AAD7FA79_9AGAR|nr:hypothetical protein FB45DRAFT_940928 [Roridomyces roridus]
MSSHILQVYGICLCTAILTFLFSSTLVRVFTPGRPIRRSTVAAIRRLLGPPNPAIQGLLRTRAAANTRLQDAFHLTNTFVSSSTTVHSDFLKQSSDLLRASRKDWRGFADVADQAVQLSLTNTPFHTFIRSVVLRTVIVGLLDPSTDITYLDAFDIDAAAELMSDLWVRSKQPQPIPQELLEKLNNHLRRLVPDEEKYPYPLDWVIPAWETLWRVVAVTVAYVDQDVEARDAFRSLVDKPTMATFRERRGASSPSAQDYIDEGLRLHPPVKRITRHISRQALLTRFLPRSLAAYISRQTVVEVADIESAQRDSTLWGPRPANVYDPRRFVDAPGLAGNILAFGYGPLQCKAAKEAPMAAALIVGAILSRVKVVHGERVGGREAGSWRGWSVQRMDGDAT